MSAVPAERPGAAGPMFITPHAVRRYCERIRPDLDPDDARDYAVALGRMIDVVADAHIVKATRDGRELWRSRRATGRLRLLVGYEETGKPQLLTVLGPDDGWRPPTRVPRGGWR